MCTAYMQEPEKAREGVIVPRAGVSDGREPPCGAGN